MGRADTVEYISLSYAAVETDVGPAAPCLLVARNLVTDEILVLVRPGWLETLPSDEREYVEELLKDWRSRTAQDIEEVFQQLLEVSVGPLRFVKSGLCYARAVGEVLQADNPLGDKLLP